MSDDKNPRYRISRARFAVPAAVEQPIASLVPLPCRSGGIELLVDVISQVNGDGEGCYAVLLSTREQGDAPIPTGWDADTDYKPNCFLAFSNVQAWGNRLRELGFNCVEAEIDSSGEGKPASDGSPLTVRIPFYSPIEPQEGDTSSTSVQYTDFVTIKGINPGPGAPEALVGTTAFAGSYDKSRTASNGGPLAVPDAEIHTKPESKLFALLYNQQCTVPEPARPRTEMSTIPSPVQRRTDHVMPVMSLDAMTSVVKLKVERARYPNLVPISSSKTHEGALIAAGELIDWLPASTPAGAIEPGHAVQEPHLSVAPTHRPRRNPFGAPTFRFEDVESIGFRLDLSSFDGADKLLEDLVDPLNFHLHGRTGPGMSVTPFRFRAASRTVVLELLRYVKMIDADSPELTRHDFTSQHELAVRVLVGRVDDETAQARSPAVFVPAIFVDNPWSKVVGRELLGYEKQLAQFCVGEGSAGILSMNGSLPTSSPEPPDVAEISALRLMSRIKGGTPSGDEIVKIRCPQTAIDAARFGSQQFIRVSEDFASPGPWTQSDFEAPEFRRSFAQEVITEGFLSFNSIQAVPVDRRDLPGAWITGRYTLKDVAIAFPSGIATLEFASPATLSKLGNDLPKSWHLLCGLLHGEPVALPTGDWYRLKCSMDLEIDDLLLKIRV